LGCSTFRPLAAPVIAAQGSNLQQKLDALLVAAVNEYRLPGLQAGIRFPDGRTVLASAGTEDFARKGRPIGDDTMFRVGSTTKMFTVAELLRHRSGLPETLFTNFGILFESGLNSAKV
jgi:CubicO group peptidase (beta-lactamase class C family)